MPSDVVLGNDFGRAVCERFGLNPEQVHAGVVVQSGGDEVFAVSLQFLRKPHTDHEPGYRYRTRDGFRQRG